MDDFKRADLVKELEAIVENLDLNSDFIDIACIPPEEVRNFTDEEDVDDNPISNISSLPSIYQVN